MTEMGYTVRVLRPYRFSPNGSALRAVFPGDELGVPEEVSFVVAASMADLGYGEKVVVEQPQELTASEILDKTAATRPVKKKVRRRRRTTEA